MKSEQIRLKLQDIFRTEFEDLDLLLTDEMVPNDVENWDSLTHLILINEIESAFNLKFKLTEINEFQNVGDIVNRILVLKSV